jgi:Ca-activated chloride channel family protein
MKTILSISIITTALFMASCAKESTEKKEPTAQNSEIKILHTVELTEPLISQELVRTRLNQDQESAKVASALGYKAMGYHQVRSPAKMFAMPPVNYLGKTDNEKYDHRKNNGVIVVNEQPVSTFSVDVDTASYANIRRVLNQGALPQHDAVRVEELINYFSYNYPVPTKQPFSVYSEIGPSPYNADKHLLHIGVKGKSISADSRPAANLVFLIDVSGSMNNPNKMGLLKNALKMLTNQLNQQDSVAIVVYAGAAGTVLKPTKGDNKQAIIDALAQLSAGGSTNGGEGIKAAYNLAQQSFIKGGINRIILATDGDFNVGTTNNQTLQNLVESKRSLGIDLSILGLGTGNYNDELMQQLAQNGNGNAYYIDNLNEARKVLVEELSSTLVTIAKDVKVQVEFNPQLVSEYRLIGYETRALKREDFNNDKVDAGDIGAGHTVTAIYEISLASSSNKANDPLRYERNNREPKTSNNSELGYLRLRYKAPTEQESQLIEIAINKNKIIQKLDDTSNNYQFSAAVAGFAQLLRGGVNLSTMELSNIILLAQQGKGKDVHGYRAEFINMVKLAQAVSPQLSANNE